MDRDVKTKHLPEYPRIAASELAALKLDRASARQFDRRFLGVELSVSFVVCASFLSAYLSYRRDAISAEACVAIMFGVVVPALVVLFSVTRRRLHARPLCLESRRKMEPHVVAERERKDSIEIAYIDRGSGSYFTRLYAI